MQHSGQKFLQKSCFGSWHGNSQVRLAGTGRLYGVVGQASAVIGYGMRGLAGAIGSRGHSGLDSSGQSPFARWGWPRQSSFYGLLRHCRPASPCGEMTRVTRCYSPSPPRGRAGSGEVPREQKNPPSPLSPEPGCSILQNIFRAYDSRALSDGVEAVWRGLSGLRNSALVVLYGPVGHCQLKMFCKI
jgi:hypothetical protein